MKRWTRILLVILLCAAMVTGLAPGVMLAAKAALSGSGTSADPYLISTADELKEFRNIVNVGNQNRYVCAKLTADIERNGIAWAPIGNGINYYGTFDGQNHKIKKPERQSDLSIIRS